MDSGAGRFFLPAAAYAAWGALSVAPIWAKDINGRAVKAEKGCPLYARVHLEDTPVVRVKLNDCAWGSGSFADCLFSPGWAMKTKLLSTYLMASCLRARENTGMAVPFAMGAEARILNLNA